MTAIIVIEYNSYKKSSYKVVRCQNCIPTWGSWGGNLYYTTKRFWSTRQRESCMQASQKLVWIETSSEKMVQEVYWVDDKLRIS